jgi:hypothetical protein
MVRAHPARRGRDRICFVASPTVSVSGFDNPYRTIDETIRRPPDQLPREPFRSVPAIGRLVSLSCPEWRLDPILFT